MKYKIITDNKDKKWFIDTFLDEMEREDRNIELGFKNKYWENEEFNNLIVVSYIDYDGDDITENDLCFWNTVNSPLESFLDVLFIDKETGYVSISYDLGSFGKFYEVIYFINSTKKLLEKLEIELGMNLYLKPDKNDNLGNSVDMIEIFKKWKLDEDQQKLKKKLEDSK